MIRIVLADDHRLLRQGLHSLLERQSDMHVLAEAGDGRAAVQLVAELAPDVVVMDIGMPDLNGIDATRQISAADSHTRVVALSMHSDRQYVTEMFRAGASGYLLKGCSFDELTTAIRAVTAGRKYLGPNLGEVAPEDCARGGAPAAPARPTVFGRLSPREREVLQLLAEGKATKQISAHLHVSVKTVETHRQRIMRKLGITSVAELTKYAIREGLTTLEA